MKRILACLLSLSPVFGFGAYLESDTEGDRTTGEPQARERRIAPPPDSGAAVIRYLDRLRVGAPCRHRGLAVFPLTAGRWPRAMGILSMDEAIRRDRLVVREQDKARVPELQVRNDARQPVFLMAGEILTGGRQNRIVRDDVLLPARSPFVAIPVYCVEKNRWAGPKAEFSSPARLGHARLRKHAVTGAEQGVIWGEVDAQLRRHRLDSPTRDYQELYESPRIQAELDACMVQLRRCRPGATVGAVVTFGGEILSADIFGNRALCAALWEKLFRAHAADCLFGPRARIGRPALTREDIRRFLDRAATARFAQRHTPGSGELLRISGTLDGSALVWNGEVVHVALFPQDEIRPLPLRE